MPGEDPESALAQAEVFRERGIDTIFTRLGENIDRIEDADATADHYLGLLAQIGARRIAGELSVKPTQLGLDIDVERTLIHLGRLADRAAQDGGCLWIDMEGSAYTERTIILYERLRHEHANVGICLQAYLRRSASDVARLLPLDPAIRLVKGAYDEPAARAYQDRAAVSANYAALAVELLEAIAAGRRVRLGLGTHDVELIEELAAHATAMGLSRNAFEVQMLYGIRMADQYRLTVEGYRVRDLIAYGTAWYPWYMRRLAERPANVIFALRQIVG